MTKYIVMNNTNNSCLVFYDINKARKAVINMSAISTHFWYLKIQHN